MKFLQGLGNDFYSDSLSGSGHMGATAADKIKLELQKRAEQKANKGQSSSQQQGNQAQAAPQQRPAQQQQVAQGQGMTREQCQTILDRILSSRYRTGEMMPLECEIYDTDSTRHIDPTLGAAYDYGFQDRIGYQGRIVPLGVLPTPLKIIPTTTTTSTPAKVSVAQAVSATKTLEQQRKLDTEIYVAQQTNSEKGYAGATITPFQVKEGLITKFNLRSIPANVLAKSAPEIGALFDILQYAVFTKKITEAQNRELRSKSGCFEGGPQPPLTFQQWLALVDQALALPSIIKPIPVPAPTPTTSTADSSADSQASDSTEDTKEGLSTGAMIGIGVGAAVVLGGIGFLISRRKKS